MGVALLILSATLTAPACRAGVPHCQGPGQTGSSPLAAQPDLAVGALALRTLLRATHMASRSMGLQSVQPLGPVNSPPGMTRSDLKMVTSCSKSQKSEAAGGLLFSVHVPEAPSHCSKPQTPLACPQTDSLGSAWMQSLRYEVVLIL